MNFFIFALLIFSLFILLFNIYIFSKDDFIILRKNIPLEKIFDFAILSSITGLLSARLFYVILNFNSIFLNPLNFLLFPYFPGLLIAGGVLGFLIFMLILSKSSKYPILHFLDIFTLSFLISFPFGLLIKDINDLIAKKAGIVEGFEFIFYIGLAVFALRTYLRTKSEEGSFGFLFIGAFSIISIVFNIIKDFKNISIYSQREDFIWLVILIISFFFFAKQQKLLSKIKIFERKKKIFV